jgi:hypothetical protein
MGYTTSEIHRYIISISPRPRTRYQWLITTIGATTAGEVVATEVEVEEEAASTSASAEV